MLPENACFLAKNRRLSQEYGQVPLVIISNEVKRLLSSFRAKRSVVEKSGSRAPSTPQLSVGPHATSIGRPARTQISPLRNAAHRSGRNDERVQSFEGDKPAQSRIMLLLSFRPLSSPAFLSAVPASASSCRQSRLLRCELRRVWIFPVRRSGFYDA